MTTWSRRRVLGAGVPLALAGIVLTGCTVPSQEEQQWVRDRQAELRGLPGVSHADLVITRHTGTTSVTATIDGRRDRPHPEVAATATAVEAWRAGVRLPPWLANADLTAELRQWTGTNDVVLRIGAPAADRLPVLLAAVVDEVDRGAVSTWASAGLRMNDGMSLTARFDHFDEALQLRPVPVGLADVTRGMMPATGRCRVATTVHVAAPLERVGLAAVVTPLASLASWLNVSLLESSRSWQLGAPVDVRSEPLVAAMVTALRSLLDTRFGEQRVTVSAPWNATFAVAQGRVRVESLPYDRATPSLRDVEPMVAEVIRRANR